MYQEVALYKVSTDKLMAERNHEDIIRRHGARILQLTPEYTVLEKTGHSHETLSLFEELKPYGIKQFTRSGRVAITKSPVEHVDLFLRSREAQRENI